MKIITMRPSHRCVLKALLHVMKPKHLIEFGSGPNSTQLLKDAVPHFTSYESHPEWVAKMRADVPGVDIRHLPVNVASFKIYPNKVSLETRKKIYADIQAVVEDTDVLFVDGYASTRIYTLLAFIDHFGVCVCHDSEKATYWYNKAEKRMAGYVKLTVMPPARVPYIDVIFAPSHAHLVPAFIAKMQLECLADYGGYASVMIKNITATNAAK